MNRAKLAISGIPFLLWSSILFLAPKESAFAQQVAFRFNGTITSISDPTNYLLDMTSTGSLLTMTFVHSADLSQTVEVDDPGTYWTTAPAPINSHVTTGDLIVDGYGTNIHLFDTSQPGGVDRIGFYGFDFGSSPDYVATWSMEFAAPYDTLSRVDIQNDWMSFLSSDWLGNITLKLQLNTKVYTDEDAYYWSTDNALATLLAEPTSIQIVAIPEPSSIASLLGLSALVIAACRRRRGKYAAG